MAQDDLPASSRLAALETALLSHHRQASATAYHTVISVINFLDTSFPPAVRFVMPILEHSPTALLYLLVPVP